MDSAHPMLKWRCVDLLQGLFTDDQGMSWIPAVAALSQSAVWLTVDQFGAHDSAVGPDFTMHSFN